MPNEEDFNSEENEEENEEEISLIERLIEHGVMENIVDDAVPESANLSTLLQRAETLLARVKPDSPRYLSNNFFGGRDASEVLT